MNTMQCWAAAAFLLLTTGHLTGAAKILMAGPQFGSHIHSQSIVAEELAARGHQVYLVLGSRFPRIKSMEEKGIKVLTFYIPPDVINGVSPEIEELWSHMIFDNPDKTMEIELDTTPAFVKRDCELMMNDKTFLDSVKKIGMDLAIVEPFILGPCALVLPKHLGIPFVSMTAIVVPWRQRIPALPSFYRRLMLWKTDLEDGRNMNFMQRLSNLFLFCSLQFEWMFKYETALLERFTNSSSWNELFLEAQLVILQADHVLDGALPVMPNVVRLPGLTATPPRPLPADLEELMTKPTEGVILLSFGTHVQNMRPHIALKFLNAFAKFNYTIIAKLNIPEGSEVPENVALRKWYPQNDILGHPRTRLFVTHCGLYGQYETIYHGIPTLGFPLFADQVRNCQTSQEEGFGLVMNIHDFTVQQLTDNLSEMLNNHKYADVARKLSAIVRDEPMSGREKAAHWIEHVLKFGGEHLRSSALDMPLYQFLMLDVMALFFALLYVILRLLECVIRLLSRRLRRRSAAAAARPTGAQRRAKAE